MAELATGAVNTLLGVIRNEARRLGRVQGDVLFIQEEMESMKSFLAHLARTRREEHDEQVRTWMNQVRILANDCNNCLDVYLYRRNPDFHRPRRGPRRYLWWGWGLWWLREMIARHHAAGQLRQLKDRARDVGERRLRYGVKVSEAAGTGTTPVLTTGQSSIMSHGAGAGARGAGAAALAVTVAPSSHLAGAAAEDDEEEDDDDDGDGDLAASIAAMDGTGGGVSTSSMNKVKDYFENRLVRWIRSLKTSSTGAAPAPAPAWIGFVLPPGMEDDPEVPHVALAKAQRHFKGRSLLVDIPEVHLESYHFQLPLRSKEILFYILRELQLHHQAAAADQSQSQSQPRQQQDWRKLWDIYFDKKELLREIKEDINKMGVDRKIEDISNKLFGSQLTLSKDIMKGKNKLQHETIDGDLDLHVLLWKLSSSTTPVAEQQGQAWKKKAIQEAAKKLQKHMGEVPLGSDDYIHILEQVFMTTALITTNAGTGTSVEDEIKEMIYMVKDMIQELREFNKPAAASNRENNAAAAGPDRPATDDRQSQEEDAVRKKMNEIRLKIREQLKIRKIMEKIQKQAGAGDDRIILILKTHHKYGWEATKTTLSLLGSLCCFAGAAILTTAPPIPRRQRTLLLNLNNQPEHMIELSVVGRYLDIVVQHTGKHMRRENIEVVRDILEECKPQEFCMDIFAQALIANPKRSTEELHKLRSILQAMQTRVVPPSSIAKKMLKFSYSDLPKEQKSCLLYLAIFPPAPPPQECKIRRSTLVGRWVAEGMITTEDWSWFSSVAEAERCFDALVDRHFVCPVDIGSTGRVKSCTVHPLVHGFITKIAKKQHIVEARLSLHLARHFSIFNDVRLRRSETILNFLKKNMHDLPQFSKLKVLDLEGCTGSIAHKGYLKDICTKILMLKYLSLRGTDANHLPREINNLHELEVLDIRQTKIPASATRHVLLLKLKRLLAGGGHSTIDTTGMTQHQQDLLSVEIPGLIEKMIDVEVLSSVRPRTPRDLRDIGSLSQLKKLGVVIKKDSHLQSLLQWISDLHECLRSLSITLSMPKRHNESARPGTESPTREKHLTALENLSIRGTAQKGQQLLQSLVREDSHKLAKVTLSDISLSQDNLKVLAKLPNLICVRLQRTTHTDSHNILAFGQDEFQKLKVLIVDSSDITKISFAGEFPELEKIFWSFGRRICINSTESLSGVIVNMLPGLKELDLIGDIAPAVDKSFKDYCDEMKIAYNHKKPENQNLAEGNNA